jgi:hypothetical protein
MTAGRVPVGRRATWSQWLGCSGAVSGPAHGPNFALVLDSPLAGGRRGGRTGGSLDFGPGTLTCSLSASPLDGFGDADTGRGSGSGARAGCDVVQVGLLSGLGTPRVKDGVVGSTFVRVCGATRGACAVNVTPPGCVPRFVAG